MEIVIALMNLEGIVLNKMGRIKKDNYHMISGTCGILKNKNNNNNKSRNKLINTENI